MKHFMLTINVEFPALSDLIAYLKDRDSQQQQIDSLAEKVNDLTAKLHTSTTGLQGSAETQTA